MEVAVESFVTAPFAKVWSACTARMAVQVGGFGFDLYGTCAQIVPNRPIKYCFGDRAGAGEMVPGASSFDDLGSIKEREKPAMTMELRPTSRGIGAAGFMAALGVCAVLARAGEPALPAPMPVPGEPPAGQYKLDKAHASLLMRVSHLGFSTYTTRFTRFDSELTFDPKNIPASKVVATIDASSIAMDNWPQRCIDILQGSKMLDTAQFPQIVFKSEQVRMTGTKSMDISGTLTLLGVTRPVVLSATYNGGYSGMPEMDPHARVGFSAHGSFKRSDFED